MAATRRCHCDRRRPGEPYVKGRDCWRCWLWHDAGELGRRYRCGLDPDCPRPKRDAPAARVVRVPPRLACVHRGGEPIGRVGKGCGSLRVYGCRVYGACTLARCPDNPGADCLTCGDRAANATAPGESPGAGG